jgi:uncharacterized protein (TIGR02265 family)
MEFDADRSRMELPAGFDWPDWDAPFDAQAYLDALPAGATGKGMFPKRLQREAQRVDIDLGFDTHFVAFKDYPLELCMRVTLEAARRLHPDAPLREGMRRVAWMSYETFVDSLIGRVVFGVLGEDLKSIFKVAAKGIGHSTNVGTMRTEALDGRTVMICAEDAYFFTECFAPALAEGVLRAHGREGWVAQRVHSLTSCEFLVHWEGDRAS